jgi:hypothetical protein
MELLVLIAVIVTLNDMIENYRFERWSVFLRLALVLCLIRILGLLAPDVGSISSSRF